jgi:UDP:flavonoid glycosyltransferase YjiC (YdhE family)
MHYVLATIGSLGDLHPMLALGLELNRRRHRVVIATIETHRVAVQAAGLEFAPMRPHFKIEPERVRWLFDPTWGPRRLLRDLIFPQVEAMYEDLAAIARSADGLVAGEIVYAAPLLAEKTGLPYTYYCTAPSSLISAYDPPVLAPAPYLRYLRFFGRTPHQVLYRVLRAASRPWGKPVSELRRKLGLSLDPHPAFEGKFSPTLNLIGFSPVFAAPQPDWPVNSVQPGFLFYDGSLEQGLPEAVERFLAAGEPPIVFTLGSSAVYLQTDFYVHAIAATQQLRRRAVLLVGKNRLRSRVPGSILVWDYLPFSQVFSRAGIVVHQGGAGTCGQVLKAGVPSVVVPFGFDQLDNASRLKRLGISETVPRSKLSPARLAGAIQQVESNPGAIGRAQGVAAVMRNEPGVAAAANAVDRWDLMRRRLITTRHHRSE